MHADTFANVLAVAWNAAAGTLTGWPKDEVMGKNFLDHLVRVEDRADTLEVFEEAVNSPAEEAKCNILGNTQTGNGVPGA